MLEHLEKLIVEAGKACEAIKAYTGTLRVVSHYDADGITSAAIFLKALARAGKRFHHSFVRQLEEPVVRGLADGKPEFVIFLDLGSGQLPWVEKYLAQTFKVIVVDHHQPQGEAGRNVIHINPLLFGIEENVSGAGMCYLMARTLSPENKDLSELAIVGAIADSQQSGERNWGLQGLNREIMKDAQETGKIIVGKGLRFWGKRSRALHKALEYGSDVFVPGVTGMESGAVQFLQELGIPLKRGDGEWRTLSELTEEEQKKLAGAIIKARVQGGQENPDWIFGDVVDLPDKGELGDANELATLINATGKLSKAYVGMAVCWNDPLAQAEATKVLESYRREIGKALRLVEDRKKVVKGNGAYFAQCGTEVSDDVISNVISILNRSAYGDLPIFGFAQTAEGKMKISARAAEGLVDKGLNLKELMASATKQVGGEGGGHAGAAGGLIPAGTEEEFIKTAEHILSQLVLVSNGHAQTDGNYGSEKNREGSAGTETGKNSSAERSQTGSDEGSQTGGDEGNKNSQTGSDEGSQTGGGEGNKNSQTGGDEGKTSQTGGGEGNKTGRGTEGTAVHRTERGESGSGQKMERKGLVLYYGASDVRQQGAG